VIAAVVGTAGVATGLGVVYGLGLGVWLVSVGALVWHEVRR